MAASLYNQMFNSNSRIIVLTDLNSQAMEITSINNNRAQNDEGIMRWWRDSPPADYILKIDSFSLFRDTKINNYQSRMFEAGGYKWKLCLCPHGNKKVGVNDHISLYIKLLGTRELPQGWEVLAKFKFFVFDHIRCKFLTVQDGQEFNRLNGWKTEWGFDRLLALDTFNDATNGYLRNDFCVFGVEIYVRDDKRKGECISTVKNPYKNTHSWIIKNFSGIRSIVVADDFVVGDQKWELQCCPRGFGLGKSTHLILFICLCESRFSETKLSDIEVYAEFKLRIIDQIHGRNQENTGKHRFSGSDYRFCFSKLLSLKDLNDESKGYIVNDTVIIEAQFTLISVTKDYKRC